MYNDILGNKLDEILVILKSGGPIMKVVNVKNENVLCEWKGDDGNVVQKVFKSWVLRNI